MGKILEKSLKCGIPKNRDFEGGVIFLKSRKAPKSPHKMAIYKNIPQLKIRGGLIENLILIIVY